jgi:hypothetical protein
MNLEELVEQFAFHVAAQKAMKRGVRESEIGTPDSTAPPSTLCVLMAMRG